MDHKTPKKKTIEEHYDDCGEDISAIDTSRSHFGTSPVGCELIETDSEDEYMYVHAQCGLEQFALFGPNLTGIPQASHNSVLFPNANTQWSWSFAVSAIDDPGAQRCCYPSTGTGPDDDHEMIVFMRRVARKFGCKIDNQDPLVNNVQDYNGREKIRSLAWLEKKVR